MSTLFNIMQAISNLNPTAQVSASSIDNITWHVGDPTSKSDIEAEVSRIEVEYDANKYQRDRRYPSIGDQLDMLFHDMTAGKGSKTGEWYKTIAKVKSDNPKV